MTREEMKLYKTDFDRIIEILDVQYNHCQNYRVSDKSMEAQQQRAHYAGFYYAYSDMFIGSGWDLVRGNDGKHHIREVVKK